MHQQTLEKEVTQRCKMTFATCAVERHELCFALCKAGERKDGELQRDGIICGSEGSWETEAWFYRLYL